ncbi:MAG: hypothetical protein ACI392_01775 [Paludibacteraceae bacterium]
MSKVRYIVIGLVSVWSCALVAQDFDRIKRNPHYVWGEGFSADLQLADDAALHDLISQISVSVDMTTETSITNEQVYGEVHSSVITSGDIKSGSNVTLTNCKRLVSDEGGVYRVLRYIDRAEIDKMYAERKTKIRDLVAFAQHALGEGRVGSALRHYYWALKLINALPDEQQNSLRDENNIPLSNHISSQIAAVLDGVQITPLQRVPNDDNVLQTLSFTYRGEPMVDGDCEYFDGYTWVCASVKDGVGSVEVPTTTAALSIRIEYEYKKLWKSDPIVNGVLSRSEAKLPFRQCNKRIALAPECSVVCMVPTSKEITKTAQVDTLGTCTKKEVKSVVSVVAAVLDALGNRQYESVREYFTTDGWRWFEKLIKYGKAVVVERPELQVTAFEGGFLCRGVKASFAFPNNNKRFVEDLVFYVKDGRVDGVNFGLEQTTMNDILQHEMWNDTSRLVLINFLECYKTAYALERLDYLDAVFSDDALIIIGTQLPHTQHSEVASHNQAQYKYVQLSKNQYIERLSKIFAAQEFVNIQFEDAVVKKTGRNNERYQIILKQNYYSTTYADKGYLFLLADLSNPTLPIIHVRVWDADKNDLMNYAEWNY